MIGIIILFISFLLIISWIWSGGIDYMNKHHKNYSGKDFLNWK